MTLTGAGECGKTRLALETPREVGQAFSDGVIIFNLAPLTDAEAVVPALAQVLGQRAIGPFALELVACLLEKKHVLLPLDTGEHLIGVCATVTGRGIAVRAPPVAAGTYRRGREPRNNGLSLGDG